LIARHETTYAEWIAYVDALPDSQRTARLPMGSQAMFRPAPALVRERDGVWSIRIQLGDKQLQARAGEPLLIPSRTRRDAQDWLRLPVTGIDRADAEAYLAWLNITGRVPGARLCDELEWERAARGADARKFPSGDEVALDDANFDETYGRDFAAMGPDEVGAHPASESPFGVHDMMGNVWEWVSSATGGETVARGGAYFFDKLTGSAMNRNVLDPQFRDGTLGLRVCASPRSMLRSASVLPAALLADQ
jgi:formylglycine-generating enzyme required for sulfatase activity